MVDSDKFEFCDVIARRSFEVKSGGRRGRKEGDGRVKKSMRFKQVPQFLKPPLM